MSLTFDAVLVEDEPFVDDEPSVDDETLADAMLEDDNRSAIETLLPVEDDDPSDGEGPGGGPPAP
jgi:hypothetical protein